MKHLLSILFLIAFTSVFAQVKPVTFPTKATLSGKEYLFSQDASQEWKFTVQQIADFANTSEKYISSFTDTGTTITATYNDGSTVTIQKSWFGGNDNWGTQVVISDDSVNGDGTSGNPLSVAGNNVDVTDPTTTNINNLGITLQNIYNLIGSSSSNIYTANGVLGSDRTVSGSNGLYSIYFRRVKFFEYDNLLANGPSGNSGRLRLDDSFNFETRAGTTIEGSISFNANEVFDIDASLIKTNSSIANDNTAIKIAALNAANEVVYRDFSTFGGGGGSDTHLLNTNQTGTQNILHQSNSFDYIHRGIKSYQISSNFFKLDAFVSATENSNISANENSIALNNTTEIGTANQKKATYTLAGNDANGNISINEQHDSDDNTKDFYRLYIPAAKFYSLGLGGANFFKVDGNSSNRITFNNSHEFPTNNAQTLGSADNRDDKYVRYTDQLGQNAGWYDVAADKFDYDFTGSTTHDKYQSTIDSAYTFTYSIYCPTTFNIESARIDNTRNLGAFAAVKTTVTGSAPNYTITVNSPAFAESNVYVELKLKDKYGRMLDIDINLGEGGFGIVDYANTTESQRDRLSNASLNDNYYGQLFSSSPFYYQYRRVTINNISSLAALSEVLLIEDAEDSANQIDALLEYKVVTIDGTSIEYVNSKSTTHPYLYVKNTGGSQGKIYLKNPATTAKDVYYVDVYYKRKTTTPY